MVLPLMVRGAHSGYQAPPPRRPTIANCTAAPVTSPFEVFCWDSWGTLTVTRTASTSVSVIARSMVEFHLSSTPTLCSASNPVIGT
ncbi:hypothetical protein D3C84_938650 [compost metagenome]